MGRLSYYCELKSPYLRSYIGSELQSSFAPNNLRKVNDLRRGGEAFLLVDRCSF